MSLSIIKSNITLDEYHDDNSSFNGFIRYVHYNGNYTFYEDRLLTRITLDYNAQALDC